MTDEETILRQRTESFGRWMGRPETKLLLSLLPPATSDTQRDCLRGLLESAFHAGHDSGQGGIAAMMLRGIVEQRGEKR